MSKKIYTLAAASFLFTATGALATPTGVEDCLDAMSAPYAALELEITRQIGTAHEGLGVGTLYAIDDAFNRGTALGLMKGILQNVKALCELKTDPEFQEGEAAADKSPSK